MSTGRSEDEAWRAIVDNYGERARLDDQPPEPGPHARPTPYDARATADVEPGPDGPDRVTDPTAAGGDEPEQRFVPPVPPPAPRLPLARRLAWLGVLGSPAALVVAMALSASLPRLLGWALVAAFLGGFGYLVWTMQRGAERDPWDDGAQV